MKFLPVKFLETGQQTTVNGYDCYTVVSPQNDTLYLSRSLPPCMNPFFLNRESIRDGVVKAVMHELGTFELSKTYKRQEKELFFPGAFATKSDPSDNIFFASH